MSYVYNLANVDYKTSVFYQSGSWIKPQGITMISITAIGAGGGGGGGDTQAVTIAIFGGGGGGSGAMTRLIIPEMFISDSLNIVVGSGGVGGASGAGTGGNGGPTYVDMSFANRGDTFIRVLIVSGGTGAVKIHAGAAGVVAAVTQSLYSTLGVWTAIAGQIGTAGTTGTSTSVVYGGTVGVPVTGGAGGGGMNLNSTASSSSGAITGSGFVATNPGGVGNTVATNGNKGAYSITPFYSTGGSGGGGGGTTPVSGGTGGVGNIGSGGGGGGAGTTPTGAGGAGGRGGDGLVIIQCW